MAENLLSELFLSAKEYGMTRLARETGIDRVQLYRVFAPDHNPTLKTMQRICRVLGYRVVVVVSDKWLSEKETS